MTSRLLVHIGIPVLVAALAILSEYSGFDLWLAGHFYDATTQTWPYSSLFITTTILHTGAKNLLVLIALINLLAIPASWFIPKLAPYRKHLIYILVAGLTGTLLVSELKSLTHIYTPWDLALFNGEHPYIRLFDPVPPGAEVGYGFPGGHSSGGFAYLGLYFVLMVHHHPLRKYGLIIPLVTGIILSLTQEIRGAHFLSHDMFSFVICWSSALIWSWIFYPNLNRGNVSSIRDKMTNRTAVE
jgi:membrane-associated PAP2 superfamily phosphatase